MNVYILLIASIAIVSMITFAYMRNRQARRNDERRERLWKKQDELMEMLKEKQQVGGKDILE